MSDVQNNIAYFHLPGLFEFFDFYQVLLPVFYNHPEYFYDWVKIGSIYGSPAGCIWGGGRFGSGNEKPAEILNFLKKYEISGRLTFSNSLLTKEHLSDKKCNQLCREFENFLGLKNGVIVHSDMLLNYLQENFPNLYFISSTTKVITDFDLLRNELNRSEFSYVVPDFRLNREFEKLFALNQTEKDKVEFLCNECCWTGCKDRKNCYENVSRRILGEDCPEHLCKAPDGNEGYRFSKAMKNPAFISTDDIKKIYLPNGFCNFKIEGRGLGTALILEFILYYMVKPEFQLLVREAVYLDNELDLF